MWFLFKNKWDPRVEDLRKDVYKNINPYIADKDKVKEKFWIIFLEKIGANLSKYFD